MEINRYINTFEMIIIGLTVTFLNSSLCEVINFFLRNGKIDKISILIIYILFYISVEFCRKKKKKMVGFYYKLLIFQVTGEILLFLFTHDNLLMLRKETLLFFIVLFIISELRFKIITNFFKNFDAPSDTVYAIYFVAMIFLGRFIIFLIMWVPLYVQRQSIIESFETLLVK